MAPNGTVQAARHKAISPFIRSVRVTVFGRSSSNVVRTLPALAYGIPSLAPLSGSTSSPEGSAIHGPDASRSAWGTNAPPLLPSRMRRRKRRQRRSRRVASAPSGGRPVARVLYRHAGAALEARWKAGRAGAFAGAKLCGAGAVRLCRTAQVVLDAGESTGAPGRAGARRPLSIGTWRQAPAEVVEAAYARGRSPQIQINLS